MPNIQSLKKVYDLNWYPTHRSYLITPNWGVSRFKKGALQSLFKSSRFGRTPGCIPGANTENIAG